MYLNGDLVKIYPGSRSVITMDLTDIFLFGVPYSQQLFSFTGSINSVQMHNTSHNISTVQQFGSARSFNNNDLLVYYDFSGDEPFFDKSGNNRHIISKGPEIEDLTGSNAAAYFNNISCLLSILSKGKLAENSSDFTVSFSLKLT